MYIYICIYKCIYIYIHTIPIERMLKNDNPPPDVDLCLSRKWWVPSWVPWRCRAPKRAQLPFQALPSAVFQLCGDRITMEYPMKKWHSHVSTMIFQFYGERMKMKGSIYIYIYHISTWFWTSVVFDEDEQEYGNATQLVIQVISTCSIMLFLLSSPKKGNILPVFSLFFWKENIVVLYSYGFVPRSGNPKSNRLSLFRMLSHLFSDWHRRFWTYAQTHAPHSGTPTSKQDVVYIAMAISATELQKAVQGFVQDGASFFFCVWDFQHE